MSFNLEGDGLCTDLFQALWTKDELNFGPSVNIPDTVVYKFGQPVSWYFTGIDGKVKKKNKHNVINAKIQEGFTKHVLAGDIVAFYISTGNDTDEGEEDDPLTGTRIEYFDRDGLHDFLFNRWKQNTGILQRFIEPKGTKNMMIRALWSPKVCLLERRTNNRNLHDRRFGIYERAVTYEGPDFHSQAAPLRGSVLPQRVQRICENIVAHVAEVSFQKQRICRMVLNFKVDAKDRLWLMWSSSIRLSSDTDFGMHNISAVSQPLTIDPIVKLPSHLKLTSQATYGRQAKPPDTFECISCARTSPDDQKHAVPYKTIIAHFEQVLVLLKAEARASGTMGTLEWPPPMEMIEAAGGVGFGALGPGGQGVHMHSIKAEDVDIPPVLRTLHPKLTSDSYARHKRDPLFLYKAAQVCEDCYLVYADYASAYFGVQPKSLVHMGTRLIAAKDQDDYLTPWGREIGMTAGVGRSKASLDTWQPVSDTSGKTRKRNIRVSRSAGDLPDKPAFPRPTPEVPGTIRTHKDATYTLSNQAETWQIGSNPGMTSSNENMMIGDLPDITEGLTSGVPESIQQREQQFFQELAASPKLKQTHPLVHMISGQQQSKAQATSYDWTNELSRQEKIKVRGDGRSPYDEPQILVEYMKPGSIVMPQEKGVLGANSSKRKAKPLKTTSAAQKHLDFLAKTIETVSKQIHGTQQLQEASSELKAAREVRKKMHEQFEKSNQQQESMVLPSLKSHEGLTPVSEEEVYENGVARSPTRMKKSAKPRVILSVSKRVTGRFLQVICTEESGEEGRLVIGMSIAQPATGEKWTLKITEKDLRLPEGKFIDVPEKSKKIVLNKVIANLQFVGTGDHVGVAYQYSSDVLEGIEV